MRQKKSNLDEMQEQKLLKIEQNGCWIAFWGLVVVIIGQVVFLPADWRTVAGEGAVLLILGIYLLIACMRRGIWSQYIAPTGRNNLLASLLAGIAVVAVNFLVSYLRYRKPFVALVAALIFGASCFVLCFLALTLMSKATLKRQKKLEEEPKDQ